MTPQSVPSVNIEITPASGIRGRLQRLNQSILEDFGNSGLIYDLKAEIDHFDDNQVSSTVHSTKGHDTELGITIAEFPWATGSAEDCVY